MERNSYELLFSVESHLLFVNIAHNNTLTLLASTDSLGTNRSRMYTLKGTDVQFEYLQINSSKISTSRNRQGITMCVPLV
jgi:hypothetical protein